ncbi:WYL domain-containing protein [Mesobacillus maritimus]|uniref:WYL domain-containing protein n=1 Tax=Mesobacillus maritimus TaxID=1643336 RepID=A0ABS7K8X6_9BACI|nr:WYL domain-containing protein [Mesobacillus maritimus]MBY0098663.1 WYL domain-containing protein [Mesobacillus maritimus]
MQNFLVRSIKDQQLVQIIYLDSNQKMTQRMVKPYEVTDQHLKGFCYLRKQMRLFAVDHILAASPLKQKMKRLS